MAYVRKLFEDNFIHYASYVIKDRAIPDAGDGLKPVQRRILHSLFEMDDGKYHKVANVVGHCMKYHPHGDQSIGSALVVLANKDLFIDRQGNFGNIFTGDEASAARYIECRASPLAKEIFYNPKITEYVDSYDGRNREPDVFPAKLPVVLLMGAEGIAVGMSTKILPYNPVEVVKAEIACLQGKSFSLQPDFPTGGIADLSEYRDGAGKVRVRAKLDTSDPKRILVTEIPFGSTTESLIASVENASRAGRIKISSISDFTTDKVEIEIRLQRGVYTEEVVDSLYAFTECEQSISCNCLVIKDEKPLITTVSEIVRSHSGSLLSILRRELEIERGELLDDLHARILERIFIEERVYKKIEDKKTQETVSAAVHAGLKPFAAEIARVVTDEDVERLLKIPIRRISLYDINKAKEESARISARLSEVEKHLAALVDYAVSFLKTLAKKLEADYARKTEIRNFSKVDVREAARRDIALRYDGQTGYIGTAVASGDKILEVSAFDKILVLRRNGIYTVVPVPEKLFVDQGLLWCAVAEKENVSSTVLTAVYCAADRQPHIKRTSIESWIQGKDYSIIPDDAQILLFSTEKDFEFVVHYAPKSRTKVNEGRFR
ncbi:MAG: DNA topoisomerase IV subunit A, partial [Rectinemataceae bacterium]